MTLERTYHVAVLMGGWANERPVSLMSGEGVAKALEARGHRVTRIDMDRQVAARIAEAAPDVVFNALHGVPGEDGTVQGMLDLMGLPYTHSGLATSVIAIDKQLTKQALVPHGIPMPGGRIVTREELYQRDPLPRPYVLKPVNEGSSVGVAIVTADSNVGNPISPDARGPWQEFAELLAEPFIKGKELTGFEVDLANQLARQLGLKVQWVTQPFDSLLIGLQQDRYDFVIASHGITPERARAVDFNIRFTLRSRMCLVSQLATHARVIKAANVSTV